MGFKATWWPYAQRPYRIDGKTLRTIYDEKTQKQQCQAPKATKKRKNDEGDNQQCTNTKRKALITFLKDEAGVENTFAAVDYADDLLKQNVELKDLKDMQIDDIKRFFGEDADKVRQVLHKDVPKEGRMAPGTGLEMQVRYKHVMQCKDAKTGMDLGRIAQVVF